MADEDKTEEELPEGFIPLNCGDEIKAVEFGLTDIEKTAAEEFMKEHYVEDRDSLGMVRGQFVFSFCPITIGHTVYITDKVTGNKKDITDIDCW